MNQEELKQRLIDVIGEKVDVLHLIGSYKSHTARTDLADYLIANGVTIRERGEWVKNPHYNGIYYCSKCERNIETYANPQKHFPYCHCGADMRGVKDE